MAQVAATHLAAAARTGLAASAPFLLQQSLGDFAITYEPNAYCDMPAAMNRIYTDLHRNILDVFNEYGVAIMTPAYVADPAEAKPVPRDPWYRAPAQSPGPGKTTESC